MCITDKVHLLLVRAKYTKNKVWIFAQITYLIREDIS